MKKTRIIAMLLAILMVFAAVSCKEPEPEHSHVYVNYEVKDDKVVKVCDCGDFIVVENSTIVESSDGLKDAIAGTSKFILVNADIELSETLKVSRDLEINLNGKSITTKGLRVLNVTEGDVVLSGEGTIAISEQGSIASNFSVIRVGDGTNANAEEELKNVSLTIGKDVTVSSDFTYGVTVFGSLTKETLIVDGTIKTKGVPAISGNGSTSFRNAETTIVVNGTVIATEENAIYHPQKGTLTINGTVEGKGGIEMKAGSLILSDSCIVKATAATPTHAASSNGCSTSGYAIVLVYNKDYAGKAELKGGQKGTIIGEVSFTISD